MFIVISIIVVLGALGWWFNRRWLAALKRRAEEEPELERHDAARAHDRAQVEADLSRWSGPQ